MVAGLENVTVIHLIRRMLASGIIALTAFVPLNPVFHASHVIMVDTHDFVCGVAVREFKTKKDWAHEVRILLEEDFPDVKKITWVCDNLNTHSIGAFYDTLEPGMARSLARRLDIVPTPKHGSWLNIAENELRVSLQK